MKIKHLEIDGYKNLSAELTHNSDLITIIGNNGSGKSNLLEALSIIFKNLYNKEKNIPFDFSIEYSDFNKCNIKIEKLKSKLSFYIDNSISVSINNYLPKKVVAIYSGDEDRLWRECYQPFYKNYADNINKQTQANMPQMLFLNKFYWDIALLCLCLSSEENKSFVENILGIKIVDKIEFKYSKNNYKNYTNSSVLNFVEMIDDKSEYTLSELNSILEQLYSPSDIFTYLYVAFSPQQTKIIDRVTVMFNNGLKIEDLSEGQKKLLLIKAALEFAGQEDTLFLLDEPDAHVHVNNKNKIIHALKPYRHNRQIIVTTHSPTITQCVNEDNLFMMDSGKFIPRKKQDIIHDITGDFWDAYQQNSFLASKKDIILLVEGKHDQEHILNALNSLKTDYNNLDFDIFQMGGESKVRPFMTGLYEAGTFKDKIYIAIYDNDKAGIKASNDGFDKDTELFGYRKLHKDKQDHDNFFMLLLPKPEDFNKDCTIESLFDANKYKDAYHQAVQSSIDYFSNKSIEEINSDIKEKSKNILAEKSKDFLVDDFKNFRALFDLIVKIQCRKIKEEDKSGKTQQGEDPIPNIEDANNIIFSLKGSGASASATYDFQSKKINILRGSHIRVTEIPSFAKNYPDAKRIRNQQLAKIDKTKEGEVYILNENIEFRSLREAILFCTTTNLHSSKAWIDQNRKSLDEYIKEKK